MSMNKAAVFLFKWKIKAINNSPLDLNQGKVCGHVTPSMILLSENFPALVSKVGTAEKGLKALNT